MTASRFAIAVFALLLARTAAATEPATPVEARHGMVVTEQHEASEAGVAILQAGGNAVDAAVAVGYALAVVDPCCGNLGGGGFMLIRHADGRATFLDFRETAPAAAGPAMYLDASGKPERDRSLYGYLAVGVPGTVMGLDKALAEYGRLDRARVMAPAIGLARDGFVLGEHDAKGLAGRAERLAADPAAAKVFLRPDGKAWQVGERLVQADLARTLGLIAEQGPDVFYRGPVAAAVASASAANGGIMTAADFAAYTVLETAPLSCGYRGYRIVSAPPPSSGGAVLCEMLNILSGWDVAALPPRSARAVHLTAEAMRRAYHDRNAELGDPAFVANPLDRLLSPAYADTLRAGIDPDRATPSTALPGAVASKERPQTTHYSVIDADGNAVAVTYTLNGGFGAAVMAPGTGFLLNNEMDDFATAPNTANLYGLVQGEANAIAPGKRPLSSMTPTIVEQDGKPVLVLGSPGGPRITTAVLQTLIDIIDHRLSPAEAVAAPRFHHQWLPDTLYYERGGLGADAFADLMVMGYLLREQASWSAVELIAIGEDGLRVGVSDPRRPAGAAKGY